MRAVRHVPNNDDVYGKGDDGDDDDGDDDDDDCDHGKGDNDGDDDDDDDGGDIMIRTMMEVNERLFR